MEETKSFWTKHYKIIFLFFIRLAEVFASSAIPSFLGVVILFMNPHENAWALMNMLALVGFAIINFRFLIKYIAGRKNRKEYYILNGIVYTIYFATSIIAYYTTGYLVYSVLFANLRSLEIFGLKTIESILVCDGIVAAFVIVFGQYAYRHMEFINRLVKKNGADAVEMEDRRESLMPMQNSRTVETLTIEEMDKAVQAEMNEAREAMEREIEGMDDAEWESNITKGSGEDVIFSTPEDPDNDIDDTDYVEDNRRKVNENAAYSSGSLWDTEMYDGRERVENPEEAYKNEGLDPDAAELPNGFISYWYRFERHVRRFVRSFFIFAKYRQNEEAMREADERNNRTEGDGSNEAYDFDTLWEQNMYQGGETEKVPERVMDFEDEVGTRTETGLENYDGDNLWDIVRSDRHLNLDDAIEEEDTATETGLEDYDVDSLWNTNIVQGRENTDG